MTMMSSSIPPYSSSPPRRLPLLHDDNATEPHQCCSYSSSSSSSCTTTAVEEGQATTPPKKTCTTHTTSPSSQSPNSSITKLFFFTIFLTTTLIALGCLALTAAPQLGLLPRLRLLPAGRGVGLQTLHHPSPPPPSAQTHTHVSTQIQQPLPPPPPPPPSLPLPYCHDGLSPGHWQEDKAHNTSTWLPTHCIYKTYTRPEALQCLAGKHIHFFGDSTSRGLYEGFTEILGCATRGNLTDKTKRYDNLYGCPLQAAEGGRVTYLFRGKMMHQRSPRDGKEPDDDVHNAVINMWHKTNTFPDFVIMNVGPHEVIGWTGRPNPTLDMTRIQKDTDEFVDFFFKKMGFKGRFVWWKAHYLQEGKVKGKEYKKVQAFYEKALLLWMDVFGKQERVTLADFYQTTEGQETDSGGVHYPQLEGFHANILLNVLCNE